MRQRWPRVSADPSPRQGGGGGARQGRLSVAALAGFRPTGVGARVVRSYRDPFERWRCERSGGAGRGAQASGGSWSLGHPSTIQRAMAFGPQEAGHLKKESASVDLPKLLGTISYRGKRAFAGTRSKLASTSSFRYQTRTEFCRACTVKRRELLQCRAGEPLHVLV